MMSNTHTHTALGLCLEPPATKDGSDLPIPPGGGVLGGGLLSNWPPASRGVSMETHWR